MTARIEISDVRNMYDPGLTDAQVTIAVNQAHTMVQEYLLGSGMSESLLAQIELNIAAHVCTVIAPQAKAEDFDGAYKVTWNIPGADKDGLQSTAFGRMALMLDTSGALSSGTSKPAGITFLDIRDASNG